MGFFEVFSGALAGFYAVVPSYGLAIILLTIAVRVLLLPLSLKQTRSMREMQAIQPEVKRIQAKHKGDRQKMNEEMMALYKEHGVNPFGGCLPLLMQFPVLIGLFYVIREPLKYMGFRDGNPARDVADWVVNTASRIPEAISDSALADGLLNVPLRVNQFLGLRLDCSSSLALSDKPTPSVPGVSCGDGLLDALPYLVLVLLMGATTYYQQRQMQARQSPDNPQAQQMQMFTKIMPVMLMFFSFSFPTGVVMYWLATNVWTIGQQHLMLGSTAAGVLPAGAQPKKAAPEPASNPGDEPPPKKPHPSKKKKRRR